MHVAALSFSVNQNTSVNCGNLVMQVKLEGEAFRSSCFIIGCLLQALNSLTQECCDAPCCWNPWVSVSESALERNCRWEQYFGLVLRVRGSLGEVPGSNFRKIEDTCDSQAH